MRSRVELLVRTCRPDPLRRSSWADGRLDSSSYHRRRRLPWVAGLLEWPSAECRPQHMNLDRIDGASHRRRNRSALRVLASDHMTRCG